MNYDGRLGEVDEGTQYFIPAKKWDKTCMTTGITNKEEATVQKVAAEFKTGHRKVVHIDFLLG